MFGKERSSLILSLAVTSGFGASASQNIFAGIENAGGKVEAVGNNTAKEIVDLKIKNIGKNSTENLHEAAKISISKPGKKTEEKSLGIVEKVIDKSLDKILGAFATTAVSAAVASKFISSGENKTNDKKPTNNNNNSTVSGDGNIKEKNDNGGDKTINGKSNKNNKNSNNDNKTTSEKHNKNESKQEIWSFFNKTENDQCDINSKDEPEENDNSTDSSGENGNNNNDGGGSGNGDINNSSHGETINNKSNKNNKNSNVNNTVTSEKHNKNESKQEIWSFFNKTENNQCDINSKDKPEKSNNNSTDSSGENGNNNNDGGGSGNGDINNSSDGETINGKSNKNNENSNNDNKTTGEKDYKNESKQEIWSFFNKTENNQCKAVDINSKDKPEENDASTDSSGENGNNNNDGGGSGNGNIKGESNSSNNETINGKSNKNNKNSNDNNRITGEKDNKNEIKQEIWSFFNKTENNQCKAIDIKSKDKPEKSNNNSTVSSGEDGNNNNDGGGSGNGNIKGESNSSNNETTNGKSNKNNKNSNDNNRITGEKDYKNEIKQEIWSFFNKTENNQCKAVDINSKDKPEENDASTDSSGENGNNNNDGGGSGNGNIGKLLLYYGITPIFLLGCYRLFLYDVRNRRDVRDCREKFKKFEGILIPVKLKKLKEILGDNIDENDLSDLGIGDNSEDAELTAVVTIPANENELPKVIFCNGDKKTKYTWSINSKNFADYIKGEAKKHIINRREEFKKFKGIRIPVKLGELNAHGIKKGVITKRGLEVPDNDDNKEFGLKVTILKDENKLPEVSFWNGDKSTGNCWRVNKPEFADYIKEKAEAKKHIINRREEFKKFKGIRIPVKLKKLKEILGDNIDENDLSDLGIGDNSEDAELTAVVKIPANENKLPEVSFWNGDKKTEYTWSINSKNFADYIKGEAKKHIINRREEFKKFEGILIPVKLKKLKEILDDDINEEDLSDLGIGDNSEDAELTAVVTIPDDENKLPKVSFWNGDKSTGNYWRVNTPDFANYIKEKAEEHITNIEKIKEVIKKFEDIDIPVKLGELEKHIRISDEHKNELGITSSNDKDTELTLKVMFYSKNEFPKVKLQKGDEATGYDWPIDKISFANYIKEKAENYITELKNISDSISILVETKELKDYLHQNNENGLHELISNLKEDTKIFLRVQSIGTFGNKLPVFMLESKDVTLKSKNICSWRPINKTVLNYVKEKLKKNRTRNISANLAQARYFYNNQQGFVTQPQSSYTQNYQQGYMSTNSQNYVTQPLSYVAPYMPINPQVYWPLSNNSLNNLYFCNQ